MPFTLSFLECRCHSRLTRLSDYTGKTKYITMQEFGFLTIRVQSKGVRLTGVLCIFFYLVNLTIKKRKYLLVFEPSCYLYTTHCGSFTPFFSCAESQAGILWIPIFYYVLFDPSNTAIPITTLPYVPFLPGQFRVWCLVPLSCSVKHCVPKFLMGPGMYDISSISPTDFQTQTPFFGLHLKSAENCGFLIFFQYYSSKYGNPTYHQFLSMFFNVRLISALQNELGLAERRGHFAALLNT